MNEESIARIVSNAVHAMMKAFAFEADRRTAYAVLLMMSLQLLRRAKGDEFVRGFLRGALVELDTPTPSVRTNSMH